MKPDDIDIPDNTPVDEAFVKDAEVKLEMMGKDLLTYKMDEAKIVQQSIAAGGPGSANEAIITLMETLDVGIRHLSRKTKVPRKKLVRMLEGIVPMPPDVVSKIHEVFATKEPSLFDFDNPSSGGSKWKTPRM